MRNATHSKRVWLLNFDADDELATRGAGTTASSEMRARFAKLGAMVKNLTGDDAVYESGKRYDALDGFAWCPTPGALRTLRSAGACTFDSPTLDVLRRVNHRKFCANLGQTLPGAKYVESAQAAFDHLSTASPTGSWVVKRALSYAGRGRAFVRADRTIDEHESWIRASFAEGDGLQVEPWVERVADYARHGFVARDGTITLGIATKQLCDARGVWSGSSPASDLLDSESSALAAEATSSARALFAHGYFGPFGVDAFRYRALDDRNATDFCPRIEINARYTMGWAVGMRAARVDLGSCA